MCYVAYTNIIIDHITDTMVKDAGDQNGAWRMLVARSVQEEGNYRPCSVLYTMSVITGNNIWLHI